MAKEIWIIKHDPCDKFEGKSLDILRQLINDPECKTINIYDIDCEIFISGESED